MLPLEGILFDSKPPSNLLALLSVPTVMDIACPECWYLRLPGAVSYAPSAAVASTHNDGHKAKIHLAYEFYPTLVSCTFLSIPRGPSEGAHRRCRAVPHGIEAVGKSSLNPHSHTHALLKRESRAFSSNETNPVSLIFRRRGLSAGHVRSPQWQHPRLV